MASHPFILLFYALSGSVNSLMGIFHKKTIEKNYFINNSCKNSDNIEIIEDQTRETGLKYGKKTFSHSGCGTAAVFNALLILGIPVPIADIIRHFEQHGASMFASFGTAPQSAVKYLKKHGLHIEKTSNKEQFEALAERSDILIFTIMNNRKSIRRMLHTMCIERNNSTYTVHNSHGRCEKYKSYQDMLFHLGDGNGKAEGVYMIGVTDRGRRE